jgi:dihydroneopterin aldolase
MNIIKVNNIRLHANHGCLEEETLIGGEYLVNLEVTTNFYKSTQSDDLEDTVDYCVLYQIVKDEMLKPRKLIETVGQDINDKIKQQYSTIKKLRTEIIKLSPPIDGDVHSVSIVIED